MVSALAPGSVAVTAMVGKSTRGSADTGSRRKPKMPNAMIDAVISVVMTGRRMQSSDSVIGSGSRPCARAARPAFRPTAATGRRSPRSRRRTSPSAITEMPWKVRSTLTGWTLAVPSLTTNTKLPLWLRCTATVGTTIESSLRIDQLGRDQRARPQRLVVVVHDAAHGDHAGGGIDGVLDHRDLAGLASAGGPGSSRSRWRRPSPSTSRRSTSTRCGTAKVT